MAQAAARCVSRQACCGAVTRLTQRADTFNPVLRTAYPLPGSRQIVAQRSMQNWALYRNPMTGCRRGRAPTSA
ncbi:hypothetical protein XFF6992_230066 [Xanthomonas citri pv. fuscans]|nr:hypothetical protein XFF6992_230066 [Xanthomonas citri pv. fuscans]SOO32315.1 hypothetical protein XFF6994_1830005 [Xanthomonas citri pv. fuscans]